MGYYDEDFYYEPSEFDGYIEELKVVLAKSIKEEFLNEMEHLRIENSELQDVKRTLNDIKREYKAKEHQLELERGQLLQTVRKERLSELLKDFQVTMYIVHSKTELLPKCDKCDEQRRIKYETPRGRIAFEECDCNNGKIVYCPKEYICTEFNLLSADKLNVWYKKRSNYHGIDEYFEIDSSTLCKTIYDRELKYEDVDRHTTFFKTEQECQLYCDYLNESNSNVLKRNVVPKGRT